jgi:hypothetical protein
MEEPNQTFNFWGGSYYNLDKEDWWKIMAANGGPETVFPKARVIVDVREGRCSLEEARKRTVDDAIQSLLNFGIVGALIFGILYGYVIGGLEHSDNAISFFGSGGVAVLSFIYYIFTFISFFAAILLVIVSVVYYKHLTVFMYKVEMQYEFLQTFRCLVITTNLCQCSLVATSLAIPFAVPVTAGPVAGLICLILSLVVFYIIGFKILATLDLGGIAFAMMNLRNDFTAKKLL